jgi:BASS family bile acid:Na+ symporter
MRCYFQRRRKYRIVCRDSMPPALQKTLAVPAQVLAWLGGQGTRAIAALVFIGIAVPPIGAYLKPFVTEAIFLLLCISFMRVDMSALRDHLKRPGIILAATGWTMLAVPLIFGVSCLATGIDKHFPDLFLGLMLQSVASPMMAAPALAALLGLETTPVLITLVTSTALVPLTAPLFAYFFMGAALTLSPLMLGLKLFALLSGSLLVAAAIRRIVGSTAIARHKQAIDGLNILFMLVFVTAVMGTVAGSFLADPLYATGLALFAFAVFFAVFGLTVWIFRGSGRANALAMGLVVSQRNMGLMLAATDGVLPGLTWLYFALGQFPIYMSPQLLKLFVQNQGRLAKSDPV